MRPGGAKEKRSSSRDGTFSDLLNELGREGWRLVDAKVLDSIVIMNESYDDYMGWSSDVGVPIRQRWTFIREV